jgi:CheY-like chemotaxis protein
MADERPRILVVDPDRVRASVIEDGLREAGVTDITALTDMSKLMQRPGRDLHGSGRA